MYLSMSIVIFICFITLFNFKFRFKFRDASISFFLSLNLLKFLIDIKLVAESNIILIMKAVAFRSKCLNPKCNSLN